MSLVQFEPLLNNLKNNIFEKTLFRSFRLFRLKINEILNIFLGQLQLNDLYFSNLLTWLNDRRGNLIHQGL